MEIQQSKTADAGKFFIEENDLQIALMTYELSSNGVMIINHTEVDANHRGEKLGKDLVAEAVKYARETNLKIEPTCPFAKKVIDETPEFQDVLNG